MEAPSKILTFAGKTLLGRGRIRKAAALWASCRPARLLVPKAAPSMPRRTKEWKDVSLRTGTATRLSNAEKAGLPHPPFLSEKTEAGKC